LNALSSSRPFEDLPVVSSREGDPPPLSGGDVIQVRKGPGGQVFLSTRGTGSHHLALKSLPGRLLFSRSGRGRQEYRFDGSRAAPGIYWIELRSEQRVIRQTLVL
jgi:hypothetical protein